MRRRTALCGHLKTELSSNERVSVSEFNAVEDIELDGPGSPLFFNAAKTSEAKTISKKYKETLGY